MKKSSCNKCNIASIVTVIVIVVIVFMVINYIIPKFLKKQEHYHSILFGPTSSGYCETGKCNEFMRCPKSGMPCAIASHGWPFGKCPNGYMIDGNVGYCVPKPDPFYN